ncbi:MAG: hypothetical protein HN964_04295 [Candidatus Jacksonbacteria bacterium]|nr:hypothetical protein [Candidatus Jacksonbacteria bacterium]
MIATGIAHLAQAGELDIRTNADSSGHGTYVYGEFSTKITPHVIFDGWASVEPQQDDTNLHEFAAGVGLPTEIVAGHLTAVPLVYAFRDNSAYSVVPSVAIVANTKRFHVFAAPKLILPFNGEASAKVVVNPLYVGWKATNSLMIGLSGTIVNRSLKRVGPFARYSSDGHSYELTVFRRQNAPAEFRARVIVPLRF